MNDIHEVLFKNFLYFSLLLEELLKKYCCLTHKRCNGWTTKFDVAKYLTLNTKNCNIQNYNIFLNISVNNFMSTLPGHRFFSKFRGKCVIMY